jgi:hypothetical protein
MSGGGGGGSPNISQQMSTAPNAGAGGIGNLVNAMFSQFGIQSDPAGGFQGKDRKRYSNLLDLSRNSAFLRAGLQTRLLAMVLGCPTLRAFNSTQS